MKKVELNFIDYKISIQDTTGRTGKFMSNDSNFIICEESDVNKAKQELVLDKLENINYHLEKYNNIKNKLLDNL